STGVFRSGDTGATGDTGADGQSAYEIYEAGAIEAQQPAIEDAIADLGDEAAWLAENPGATPEDYQAAVETVTADAVADHPVMTETEWRSEERRVGKDSRSAGAEGQ